jgi:hypothetical protein
MGMVTMGFSGRTRDSSPQLPPGQYLTDDFPVLSAGPTPRIPLETWQLTVTTELSQTHQWSWAELIGLPAESIATRHSLRDAVVETEHHLARCFTGHRAQPVTRSRSAARRGKCRRGRERQSPRRP